VAILILVHFVPQINEMIPRQSSIYSYSFYINTFTVFQQSC